MPKQLIYPGAFDPITLGHIDVIKRALKLFGKVTVAVTDNPRKKPTFSVSQRVSMVKKALEGINGVKVESFNGLLVDYAKKKKAQIIIRGLRELSDFEFEFQNAIINRKLGNIETILIVTDPKYFYLSSSVVKEIAGMGGNISCFVPENVEFFLKKGLKKL